MKILNSQLFILIGYREPFLIPSPHTSLNRSTLIFSFLFVVCVGPSSGKVENEVKDSVGQRLMGNRGKLRLGGRLMSSIRRVKWERERGDVLEPVDEGEAATEQGSGCALGACGRGTGLMGLRAADQGGHDAGGDGETPERAREWNSGCGWAGEQRWGAWGEIWSGSLADGKHVQRWNSQRFRAEKRDRRDSKYELRWLFMETGTSMGSIVAENHDWKQSEESRNRMKAWIFGKKEIKFKVWSEKSLLMELCFLCCQQVSVKMTGRVISLLPSWQWLTADCFCFGYSDQLGKLKLSALNLKIPALLLQARCLYQLPGRILMNSYLF